MRRYDDDDDDDCGVIYTETIRDRFESDCDNLTREGTREACHRGYNIEGGHGDIVN